MTGLLRRTAITGRPLGGNKLVRLIHLDETGTGNATDDAVVIVAGTIMEPDICYRQLEDELRALAFRYVPEDKYDHFVGFHAKELFNGSGKVFKGWPIEKTLPIIRAMLRMYHRHSIPVIYGACPRDRYSAIGDRPTKAHDPVSAAHENAFLQVILRANRWMKRHARPDEVAMIVVEDNDKMRHRLRNFHHRLKYPTDGMAKLLGEDLPLERIIESILFAKKHESSVLPLADLAALILKRRIANRRLDGLFEWLAPRINRDTIVENDPVEAALRSVPKFTCRWGHGRMVQL